MWQIFWRSIKERAISLFIFCLSGILLVWMYLSFFPSIQKQAADFEKVFAHYPQAMLEAFDIEPKSLTTIEGFLGGEQFSFVWPLMLILLMVGYAGSALAQEIEKGTMETLLSLPVSRLKVFLARYLAGVVLLFLFVALTVLLAIPLISVYHFEFQPLGFYLIFILGFLLGLAIYSVAIFFSSIFSDKGKVNFAMGALLVLMYVLKLIAALKEELSSLKYLSFFCYFDHNKTLLYHQLDPLALWVFFGVALIFTLLAMLRFVKRDI